jgi:hypothetical protein
MSIILMFVTKLEGGQGQTYTDMQPFAVDKAASEASQLNPLKDQCTLRFEMQMTF